MTGFNATSHGSQDFYPTFLKSQLGLGPTQVTVITVVGQIGALIGGTTIGYISTFAGRRLTMITGCALGGAILPAYVLPHNMSLVATAFFEQFFVGGVWGKFLLKGHKALQFSVSNSKRIGVMPIHLLELSPPALRTLLVGLTYQLGNLASSASATIQAIIALRFPLPPTSTGTKRYDYGKVIGIFMGAVWAYDIFFLFWGPEMAQSERNEEAAASMHYERLRKEGVSMAEIGMAIARGELKTERIEDADGGHDAEKAKVGVTEHLEG